MISKKARLLVVASAISMLIALGGCAGGQSGATSSDQQSASASEASAASSSAQGGASNSASAKSSASPSSASNSASSSGAQSSSSAGSSTSASAGSTAGGTAGISEEDAKAAALAHAGLAEGDVEFIFAHQDLDDGVLEWEIEFISGNTEYDYNINAQTGDIVSFDNEVEYRASAQGGNVAQGGGSAAAPSGDYIAPEDAKAKALADAGIAEADCVELGVELETEASPVYYDVDFTSAGMEYSYMVDALSGEIIAHSSEIDD